MLSAIGLNSWVSNPLKLDLDYSLRKDFAEMNGRVFNLLH
jgi:hypothetical protein